MAGKVPLEGETSSNKQAVCLKPTWSKSSREKRGEFEGVTTAMKGYVSEFSIDGICPFSHTNRTLIDQRRFWLLSAYSVPRQAR